MATKIILKKSSTAGAVPLVADLDAAELAINLADRKIYTKNNSGAIVTLQGAYVDSVAPGTPAEGDLWYDTTSNYLKAYNGSSWVNAGFTTLGEFGITATAAELNVLDGITATTTELNYVDGVTSAIQTQLDGKSSTSHNHTLDSLSNTTITSNSAGEILKWNGSAWVNNTLAEAGISAVGHTHTASNITDFTEAAQDAVGSIISGSGIVSVTYNDTANTIVVSASESDTLATVTGHGATTGTAISITNATASTSTTTGALKVTGGVGVAGNLNVGGDTVITGNLTVNGTTTTVNSNTVNIGDNIIVLNADETGTPSQNAGFEVERGTAANVAFIWDESTDAWDFGSYPVQNVVLDGGSY